MSRRRIWVYLGLAIAVVTLIWGRGLVAGEDREHRYLIRNASFVLTMDPRLGDGLLGLLKDADVLIVGDQIEAVGDLARYPADPARVRVIDGHGMLVMPGFVDTHDHLWQSIIRGCGTDGNVSTWFTKCGFPLNRSQLSESDTYAAVRLSTIGLISTGVTTVVDWSHAFNPGFVRGNLRALNDSGLRYVFAMDISTGTDLKVVKAEFIDSNPLATVQVAGRPGDPKGLEVATALARELGVKLHFHILEDPAASAERDFKALEDSGAFALGRDLLAAHAIHMKPERIAKFAEVGVAVSHQPLSNMRLASGIMPYSQMQDAGIRIGLGLDGGTNDTTDAFNNMRAAVGLQRALAFKPLTAPTVEQVLRAATMGGAEVIGMESRIGSLTPGKQADVLVIDMRALNFAPVFRPAAQLVFNAQPQNVSWMFVAGRVLKEDGNVKNVNERQVIEAAQTVSDRIAPLLEPTPTPTPAAGGLVNGRFPGN